MGHRGPEPDHAKRAAFARLISEGVPSLRASRMVGIDPRTGKGWRNGRRIASGGRVLDLPPVITPSPLPSNGPNRATCPRTSACACPKNGHHQKLDLERHPTRRRRPTASCGPRPGPWPTTSSPTRSTLHCWRPGSATPPESSVRWRLLRLGGYANPANYPAPLRAAGLHFSEVVVWVPAADRRWPRAARARRRPRGTARDIRGPDH